ncbi:M20 family metallopeptidase [Cohnella cellulosilytica]|uniref:Probable succinyl-diaminopimelate desuccinylase n=1 Tax=Cohnella cellulosilytica TaxID=986710 RepID=A0ABW2FMJ7_9BACL
MKRLANLKIDPGEVDAVLRDLVAIPSVNPAFAGGTGEAGVAAYAADYLRRNGALVEEQPVLPGRSNVLGRLPASEDGPMLLLEAHMDTVQTTGMTVDPFAGRIEDGRLYGRGACDTKASLAAMLVAVGTLGRSGGSLPTGVHLAAVVDEEVEYRGVSVLAGAISAGRLRVDAAVVGEPTELHRVVAHKGCVRFHIEVRGMSGHSSEPAKGINAIQSMAEVLSFLRNEIEPGYEALRHAWVGPPTHCVSEIVGGDAPNTIPGFCRVTVDRRTVPGEDPLAVRAALEERLHGLARRTPGLSLTVGKPFIVDYAMEVDPRSPIVRRLEAATEKFAAGKRNLGAAYGTDASKLARVGVPTVVFGPGSIAQAHTSDEWVSLAETRTAAATLLDLIVHYREDEET